MKNILLSILLVVGMSEISWAENVYEVDLESSSIKNSVRYTVVGNYTVSFEEFDGRITYDPNNIENCSAEIVIKASSLKSNFETLDNIVRSPKLLDTQRYPNIQFTSSTWEKDKKGFKLKGELDMHGVQKEMTFSYMLDGPHVDESGRKFIEAKGKWIIPRKDFKIIWNSWLDRGGFIVGNHMTVRWKVKAYLKDDLN